MRGEPTPALWANLNPRAAPVNHPGTDSAPATTGFARSVLAGLEPGGWEGKGSADPSPVHPAPLPCCFAGQQLEHLTTGAGQVCRANGEFGDVQECSGWPSRRGGPGLLSASAARFAFGVTGRP